jgi:hypothetical protein
LTKRRAGLGLVISSAAVVVSLAIVAGAAFGVRNRVVFGEFFTADAPPRVDYCGRRYYPGHRIETLAQVNSVLAENGLAGLTQIDWSPSGMPVVTNVLSPAQKASFHTDVCTMSLWVKIGPDAYLAYYLSGGP